MYSIFHNYEDNTSTPLFYTFLKNYINFLQNISIRSFLPLVEMINQLGSR